MKNNFQGLEGQLLPEMSDEIVRQVSDRYIELYEKLTGETFIKTDTSMILDRIQSNVEQSLKNII